MSALTVLRGVADRWDPPPRRYATPGQLARTLDPSVKNSPALDLLDRELVDLTEKEGQAFLAFYMPPQEGKSERVSRRYVEWLLEYDPTLRIGVVSFELEAAVRWGRTIKRDVEGFPDVFSGVRIRQDSRAAGRWDTSAGGGVYCVGISGSLTGRPLDILVIDDPVKDRADAESRIKRDRAWDFWENVAIPRLSARAKVVLIMTRWQHDDLGGRMEERTPEEWKVVSVPAIATSKRDPLGRKVGEAMVSVRGRTTDYFGKLRAKLSPYVFTALYQQTPTVAEGNLFKRADWRFWDEQGNATLRLIDEALGIDRTWKRDELSRFITVDLAASTKTSADYTVAAAWGISPLGDVVLLDRVRDRVEEDDHFALVRELRDEWLGPFDVTYVEKNMIGSTLVYAAGQAGIPFAPLDADADKLTRALPAASLVRQHKVWLPHASWLDDWLDEHAEFPRGAHDDQVDVMAYAARIAVAHWIPAEVDPAPPVPGSREFDAMSFNF